MEIVWSWWSIQHEFISCQITLLHVWNNKICFFMNIDNASDSETQLSPIRLETVRRIKKRSFIRFREIETDRERERRAHLLAWRLPRLNLVKTVFTHFLIKCMETWCGLVVISSLRRELLMLLIQVWEENSCDVYKDSRRNDESQCTLTLKPYAQKPQLQATERAKMFSLNCSIKSYIYFRVL